MIRIKYKIENYDLLLDFLNGKRVVYVENIGNKGLMLDILDKHGVKDDLHRPLGKYLENVRLRASKEYYITLDRTLKRIPLKKAIRHDTPVPFERIATITEKEAHQFGSGVEYINESNLVHTLEDDLNGISITGELQADKIIMKEGKQMNIKQIIYNETEAITTVIFEDGEVVLVKKAEGTKHDIYQAVASAVVRRVYGSNTAYKRQIENVKVITPKPKKSPEEQFESALNNFVGYILGKINNEDTEEGED